MITATKPLLFHAMFFCISYFVVCLAIDKVADVIALSKGILRGSGAPWYLRLCVGGLVGLGSQIMFSVLQLAVNEILARIVVIAVGATIIGFFAGRQVTWVNPRKAIIFDLCLSILGAVAVNVYGPLVGRFVVSAMLGVAIALALEIPEITDVSSEKPKEKTRFRVSESDKTLVDSPPDRSVEPPDEIEIDAVKQPEIRYRGAFDLKTTVKVYSAWMFVSVATILLSGCSASFVTYDGHSPLPIGSKKVFAKVVASDQNTRRFRIGNSLKPRENMLVNY
ncbi:MAG: hypothetical protein RLY39_802, partial [Actinomycetota bacterium]